MQDVCIERRSASDLCASARENTKKTALSGSLNNVYDGGGATKSIYKRYKGLFLYIYTPPVTTHHLTIHKFIRKTKCIIKQRQCVYTIHIARSEEDLCCC